MVFNNSHPPPICAQKRIYIVVMPNDEIFKNSNVLEQVISFHFMQPVPKQAL